MDGLDVDVVDILSEKCTILDCDIVHADHCIGLDKDGGHSIDFKIGVLILSDNCHSLRNGDVRNYGDMVELSSSNVDHGFLCFDCSRYCFFKGCVDCVVSIVVLGCYKVWCTEVITNSDCSGNIHCKCVSSCCCILSGEISGYEHVGICSSKVESDSLSDCNTVKHTD